jgi:hypothetical protein
MVSYCLGFDLRFGPVHTCAAALQQAEESRLLLRGTRATHTPAPSLLRARPHQLVCARLCARAVPCCPPHQPQRSPTTLPSTVNTCERRRAGRGAALQQGKRWRGVARTHAACVPSGLLSPTQPSISDHRLPATRPLCPAPSQCTGASASMTRSERLGLSSTYPTSLSCER